MANQGSKETSVPFPLHFLGAPVVKLESDRFFGNSCGFNLKNTFYFGHFLTTFNAQKFSKQLLKHFKALFSKMSKILKITSRRFRSTFDRNIFGTNSKYVFRLKKFTFDELLLTLSRSLAMFVLYEVRFFGYWRKTQHFELKLVFWKNLKLYYGPQCKE